MKKTADKAGKYGKGSKESVCASGDTDAAIPVCSGDMLMNLFDEYMGFLIP